MKLVNAVESITVVYEPYSICRGFGSEAICEPTGFERLYGTVTVNHWNGNLPDAVDEA